MASANRQKEVFSSLLVLHKLTGQYGCFGKTAFFLFNTPAPHVANPSLHHFPTFLICMYDRKASGAKCSACIRSAAWVTYRGSQLSIFGNLPVSLKHRCLFHACSLVDLDCVRLLQQPRCKRPSDDLPFFFTPTLLSWLIFRGPI